MKKFLFKVAFTLMTLSLFSCGSYKPAQVSKPFPLFIPEKVFTGKLNGEGAIFNRFGKLQRTFKISLVGTEIPNGVKLDEVLTYDNGKVENRIYNIVNVGSNQYKATADSGLVGEALLESNGNVLHWKYTFEVPYRGKTRHMQFDDWMYLQENGTIINRANISWWGLDAAVLFMTITPQSNN